MPTLPKRSSKKAKNAGQSNKPYIKKNYCSLNNIIINKMAKKDECLAILLICYPLILQSLTNRMLLAY